MVYKGNAHRFQYAATGIFRKVVGGNDKFFSLGRTAAAPRPRRPLTASILASLPPLPIASNALSGNFYTRFLRFLSIFRDF